MELVRLQKILAQAGFGSRRACEEFIVQGRVTVDGTVVTQLGSKADPDTQVVEMDGQKVTGGRTSKGVRDAADKVYYMLNKPRGVLSTNEDPSGRPLAIQYVADKRRIYCVGRLDMDTEGLLLLTNDGELTNQLTHPRYGVEKVYVAKIGGPISGEQIRKLENGVHLAEGRTGGAGVRVRKRGDRESAIELTISEGMNRQVRRMLAAVGLNCRSLKRVGVGPLRLGELEPGQSRRLTGDEVRRLRQAIAQAQTGSQPQAETTQRQSSEELETTKRTKKPRRKSAEPAPAKSSTHTDFEESADKLQETAAELPSAEQEFEAETPVRAEVAAQKNPAGGTAAPALPEAAHAAEDEDGEDEVEADSGESETEGDGGAAIGAEDSDDDADPGTDEAEESDDEEIESEIEVPAAQTRDRGAGVDDEIGESEFSEAAGAAPARPAERKSKPARERKSERGERPAREGGRAPGARPWEQRQRRGDEPPRAGERNSRPWEKREGRARGPERSQDRAGGGGREGARDRAPRGQGRPWQDSAKPWQKKREFARPDRGGGDRGGGAGVPARGTEDAREQGGRGERRPWEKREPDARPWQKREPRTDAKPWQKHGDDRAAKPWQKSGDQGGKKPWQRGDDRAAKPWQKRDDRGGEKPRPSDNRAERKPWQKREGGGPAKPWQKRDSAGKTWQKREGGGTAKPWQKRDSGGPAKPWQKRGDGDKPARPWEKREPRSGQRPWPRDDSKRRPGAGYDPERRRPSGKVQERRDDRGSARPWEKQKREEQGSKAGAGRFERPWEKGKP